MKGAQEPVCQEFETAGRNAAGPRYGDLFQIHRGRHGNSVSEPDQSVPSRLRSAQPQALHEMGVVMRGKWDKFSLEMLIMPEARIGRKVCVEFAV